MYVRAVEIANAARKWAHGDHGVRVFLALSVTRPVAAVGRLVVAGAGARETGQADSFNIMSPF